MTAAPETIRTEGYGGTDVAVLLLGKVFGRTHVDIYLDKTAQSKPFKETKRMKAGKLFEEPIAQLWADEHGVQVRRCNKPVTRGLLRGNIDRKITHRPRQGLEVKLSSADGWGTDDTEKVPPPVLAQCATYITIERAELWHVAAFLYGEFGPDLHSYVIPRDDDLCDHIIDVVDEFDVRYVKPGIAPEPQTEEEAKRLWARTNNESETLVLEDTLRIMRDFELAKAHRKAAEKIEGDFKMQLLLHMEDKALGTKIDAGVNEKGRVLMSWKEQDKWTLNQETLKRDHPDIFEACRENNPHRVLRVLKAGKLAAEALFECDAFDAQLAKWDA
jgi:predicted phage-related endonuclease